MKKKNNKLALQSRLVATGRKSVPGSPLNSPLIPASNYMIGGKFGYARNDGTPTWESLEEVLGGLEDGMAVAFSSGMAAVAAVFDQLNTKALVALPFECYRGVTELAENGAKKGRWQLQRISIDDTSGWIEACLTSDLVWLESPSNPLLSVADLEVICAAPRKKGAILAVDNTFATPLNQQPLSYGATVSVQSTTKFIGGHSDLMGGVATTNSERLWKNLVKTRMLNGATPGALESFLTIRGARTLAVRIEKAQQSAMILAERLEKLPEVTRVRYPGLPGHPTHQAALKVLRGFGSIISFEVEDGKRADLICKRADFIQHATSLGAVESTIERRGTDGTNHIPASLIRLSVGIEDVEDLWRELKSIIQSE